MHVLITGTTGYIAKRLIPLLLRNHHRLTCCVRDLDRIPEELKENQMIQFLEIDFLEVKQKTLPKDIDIAYYLIHSMSSNNKNFSQLETTCAQNFKRLAEQTNCQQVIYLSGIINDDSLSLHLKSRYAVEQELSSKQYALTTLRAGIIVGSGSASFEIIRDLVEKLPVMIAPKWLKTKSQPIAIRDVLHYLMQVMNNEKLFNHSYDIYGPEVLTYKEMLLQFAEVRKLKRYILSVPVMTPRLSSYWLYFVTSTTYRLATALVDSMKVEIIGKPSEIQELIPLKPLTYKQAVENAFIKIAQNSVVSSWTDAVSSGVVDEQFMDHIHMPSFGCFKDIRCRPIEQDEKVLQNIWRIGGENGWYVANSLWRIRGILDKMVGGVGLRRGRRHPEELKAGDALDFWRVLLADKDQKRLLLFAEMKLPGEAWLEFRIVKNQVFQRAVFRPKGLWGRLYWYAVLPFHGIVFSGMINRIARG